MPNWTCIDLAYLEARVGEHPIGGLCVQAEGDGDEYVTTIVAPSARSDASSPGRLSSSDADISSSSRSRT